MTAPWVGQRAPIRASEFGQAFFQDHVEFDKAAFTEEAILQKTTFASSAGLEGTLRW